MKRTLFITLATVTLTAAMLAACSNTDSTDIPSSLTPATSVPKETLASDTESNAGSHEAKDSKFIPITLRVAYMPNMGSASAIIAARDGGFFEEYGINVEIVQFQGGPAEIAAMASGDIDISQIGHGAHALCIEGEAKIFGLDLYGKSDEILANTDRGIKSIEDLKGKKVAVTAGTSSEIVLNLALEKAGMSKDDLELVEMDANGAVTAMINGKVDACASWSPSTNIIQEQMGSKVTSLAGNADFFDKVAFPGSFIVTDAFAQSNRDDVVRFYAAILKAMDYRKDNVDKICQWLAEEIEADPQTILDTKNNYEWLTANDVEKSLENGSLKSCYESQQQVFIDSGRITQKIAVEDYVMFDIMVDALHMYTERK